MLAKDGAEPYDAPNKDNIEQFHQTLKASGIPVSYAQGWELASESFAGGSALHSLHAVGSTDRGGLGLRRRQCTVRMTMGQDIDGACGQLALEKGVKKSSDRDIEDMVPARGTRGAVRTREAAAAVAAGGKGKAARCDDAPVGVVSGRVGVALDAVRVFVALSGPAAIACSLLLGALRARR